MNSRRYTPFLWLALATGVVGAVVYIAWPRSMYHARSMARTAPMLRRKLPAPFDDGGRVAMRGDDPLSVARRWSASPQLLRWIEHAQPALFAGQMIPEADLGELDRICQSTPMSFANWTKLAGAFRRLPAGFPILRAAIRQAAVEIATAPSPQARKVLRQALAPITSALMHDSDDPEDARLCQQGYELLIPLDSTRPTRYDTAAYLRTEAINRQGRHAEAAQALRNLIAGQGSYLPKPEAANWEYMLGMCLFQDRRYDEAIPHFRVGEKKIKGHHRNDALPFLVISLVRLNRLDEAAEQFRRMSKEFPNSTFYQQAAIELSARRRAAEARVYATFLPPLKATPAALLILPDGNDTGRVRVEATFPTTAPVSVKVLPSPSVDEESSHFLISSIEHGENGSAIVEVRYIVPAGVRPTARAILSARAGDAEIEIPLIRMGAIAESARSPTVSLSEVSRLVKGDRR
jgi:TolA-binding protein